MILCRTPLRVSFGGGGTDLPEYYRNNGYGAVCSVAIDKYVYTVVKELPDLFPFRYKIAYSETELVNAIKDIKHPIVREALRSEWTLGALDLAFLSDVPAGTGLGSSSSFTVGLLNGLAIKAGTVLTKEELAKTACDLEIRNLGEPIGKQDQYAAAYGGLNYIRFNANESVEVSPIVLDPERERLFFSHLRLYYLGTQSRSASAILKSQKKTGSELDDLRNAAKDAAQAFTEGSPITLGGVLHHAWELKKSLSPQISNSEIDRFYILACRKGAYGGKLLGAGGSGFLLICAPPDAKIELGLKQVQFKPDYQGAVSYYV